MRPLVVVTSRLSLEENVGGVEAVAEELVTHLGRLRSDWNVKSVFAFKKKTRFNSLPVVGDVLASIALLRKSRDAHAIVLHGTEYALPLALFPWYAKKTVGVWHGTRAYEIRAQSPRIGLRLSLYARIENAIQGLGFRFRKQVAITPTVVEEVKAIYGNVPSEITVIPNGMPEIEDVESRRSSDAFVAVWSGTTAYKKGLDIALEACRIARERIPNLELHVLGQRSGPSCEDWVRWLGTLPRERARSEVASADVFLSTARYEGFSIAILEALSLGAPVIASPASGWLVEGVGAVVRNYDPHAYADALCRLSESPPERSAVLQRTAKYRRDFAWDFVASRYADVVAAILAQPSTTARIADEKI